MELDVVFRNNKQQKLIGTLSTPTGLSSCPGIVMCHGFTGNKEGHFFPELSQALVAEGFAVLRFDCRHCGKSEGSAHPTYKTMVDDLQAAMNFLKNQELVNRIGIAGHSMGGASVILIAAQDPEINAVVTFAAVAHPERSVRKKRDDFTKRPDGSYVLEKHHRVYVFDEQFFTDGEAADPLGAVARLDAPILFIHGTADERIGLEEAKELFIAAKLPKSIKMIEGADHCFREHYKPLIDSTVSFFKKWLLQEEA